MTIGARRRLGEHLSDSAHAHRPLIEDRRKVALRGARKHVATIHQRKSSPVKATPRGLLLGSVKFGVRLPAQAFGRDRLCRVKNALENDSFGWNDSRHLTDYGPHCTPYWGACLRCRRDRR